MRRIVWPGLLLPALAAAHTEDYGAVRLVSIAPSVYAAAPTFAGANGAIVINDDYVLVVDTHGSPASAAALVDAVRELTSAPVRYVVNTHWHVDHHSGNEAWEAAWPDHAVFISHDTTREDIPTLGAEQFAESAPYRQGPLDEATAQLESGLGAHGGPLEARQRAAVEKFRDGQQAFLEQNDEFEFRLADLTLSRRLTLHASPHRAEIMHLYPAHTRGDIVVWLPESRTLIAGDVLTRPILWTWAAYPSDYVRTLRALEALDPAHIVIGHGGPVETGSDYIATARGFIEAVIAAVGTVEEDAEERLAVAAALEADAVRQFHAGFGGDELPVGMFNQMVTWTAARAHAERRGEL